MKKTIVTFVCMLMAVASWAHDAEVDGIFYVLYSDTKEAEVTFQGSMASQFENEYSGTVIIPSSIEYEGVGYKVTAIRKQTFYNCTELVSVTIPSSVTSIGTSAFAGCTGLTSVEMPNSVVSIGNNAFWQCERLETVNIPASLTSIGDATFMGCASLSTVVVPDAVTYIGTFAFQDCSGLISVTIGKSVKDIEGLAFKGCDHLKTVTCLAENVPSTSSDAFMESSVNAATLKVPKASLQAYKDSEPWNEFATVIPVDADDDAIHAPSAALCISQYAGIVTVSELRDGATVKAYGANGCVIAMAKASGKTAYLDLSAMMGSIAILSIDGKSTKIIIR